MNEYDVVMQADDAALLRIRAWLDWLRQSPLLPLPDTTPPPANPNHKRHGVALRARRWRDAKRGRPPRYQIRWGVDTHCQRGHRLEGANVKRQKNGMFYCQPCFTFRLRLWRRRRRHEQRPPAA